MSLSLPLARHGHLRGRPVLRSAYGAGHFAKSLAWSFTDMLLAYYVNMRVGLSARETGLLLLLLSMGQGAALDVGVAVLLRRAEGDRRRILAIQLVAGLATAIALVVVFSPARWMASPFLFLIPALGLFRVA